jgi:hypothetical protein
MKIKVTTSNTTTAATIGANKVRGDRVVATTGDGGITNLATGNGLTGGPITLTGTISANSANVNQAGVVQLNDTVTSNSVTRAATPNSVNAVYLVSTSAYNIANLAYAQANSVFDQANLKLNIAGGTITGSLTIDGNLTVSGNTTTLNVETLSIEDNEIILNSSLTGTPTLNASITVNRGNSTNVFLRWDESTDNWGWSDVNGNFYSFQIARDAYNQANTGYNIAVNANNTAINANTTANGAFNQANLAYSLANAAYAQANSDYQPAVTELAVTNNGATAYRFDQYGTVDNPAIYVRAGETIAFNLNNAGHPFTIRVSSGGANYDTGLTHVATDGTVSTGSSAQGKVSGKLYWKIPYALQGNAYVYQCTVHSGMVGNIVIETNSATIYAQANAAYNQANAAYTQANNAYSQANTATSIAQNAYDQANTANATAGMGYIIATSAYGQANAARLQANNAYAQANLAYDAANNAAVKVTANSGASFSANTLSFNNTATVSVTVEQNGTNANISFTAAPQVIVNDTYTAQGNVTAAATANIANGLYLIATNAYGQANAAYSAANSKLSLTGGSLSGSLNISGDLNVTSGNIYLSGNTTFINVATFVVDDALIYLGSNNTISDTVDLGFVAAKNNGPQTTHTGLARDASDDTWYLFDNLPDAGHQSNVIDFANTNLATLRANINANSILLSGNSVATVIDVSAAYNQANLAYNAANNAAVRVTANSGSTVSANVLSFNNTSSIAVTVTGAGSNANVSFAATNAVSSRFTTNGSTNTYTLSSSVSSVNNILVTIDGVTILPTEDYTVSGTTLTLTFMPPNGLNIEARTLR